MESTAESTPLEAVSRRPRLGLAWQIVIGLAVGIAVGYALNHFPQMRDGVVAGLLQPAGDLFIKLIRMIVVPIVFTSMVIGIAGVGDGKLDIESIVKRARAKKPGLFILVDAVQHAPHGVIDLSKTPVDGINFAPYKFFGCRGSGMSWLSPRAAQLPHHRLNAKQPEEWELGSPAPAQFAVVSAIVDYVTWIGQYFSDQTDRRALFVEGMRRIEGHERALLAALLDGYGGQSGLRKMRGVEVYWDEGDLTKRDLIVGIGFEKLEPTQAVREYEKRGVIVYERVASSLYSGRMLKSFNLSGAVRVSPLHCHTPRDIVRFLAITEELAAL